MKLSQEQMSEQRRGSVPTWRVAHISHSGRIPQLGWPDRIRQIVQEPSLFPHR